MKKIDPSITCVYLHKMKKKIEGFIWLVGGLGGRCHLTTPAQLSQEIYNDDPLHSMWRAVCIRKFIYKRGFAGGLSTKFAST